MEWITKQHAKRRGAESNRRAWRNNEHFHRIKVKNLKNLSCGTSQHSNIRDKPTQLRPSSDYGPFLWKTANSWNHSIRWWTWKSAKRSTSWRIWRRYSKNRRRIVTCDFCFLVETQLERARCGRPLGVRPSTNDNPNRFVGFELLHLFSSPHPIV